MWLSISVVLRVNIMPGAVSSSVYYLKRVMYENSRWNFATMFHTRKVDWCGYPVVKMFADMLMTCFCHFAKRQFATFCGYLYVTTFLNNTKCRAVSLRPLRFLSCLFVRCGRDRQSRHCLLTALHDAPLVGEGTIKPLVELDGRNEKSMVVKWITWETPIWNTAGVPIHLSGEQ